jgi:CRP/FNR family cyclic AMP-dependent transcriptional regulator
VLERFTGEGGHRRLVDALCRQTVVQGDVDVAAELADVVELREYAAGSVLIEQGGDDNDLLLLLVGAVAILVNGREVATRVAEQHVGEMAVVDPKARRAATVVATEATVVGWVSEAAFSALAHRHTRLWRNLACELADRLRQRNELVRQRNEVARVFVGSSRESLEVANAVQAGLATDPFLVTVWTNGVFGPSEFPIEALERVAVESDFAILILGPDDEVLSRDMESLAPRDNVVFELGLFIGAAGRLRVFLLVPHGLEIKIPTDLLGVTPIWYSPDDSVDVSVRLQPACEQLRRAISERGPR